MNNQTQTAHSSYAYSSTLMRAGEWSHQRKKEKGRARTEEEEDDDDDERERERDLNQN